MNTSLNIQTESQISELKFSELAAIYNTFAAELGLKEIKKFRDKSTGIARILKIQAEYIEDRDLELAESEEECTQEELDHLFGNSEEVKAEPKKVPSKRDKYDLSKSVTVASSDYTAKEDSINDFIISNVASGLYESAEEIIELIISEFKRPTNGESVDRGFARVSIIYLIKNNLLVLN